MELSIVLSLVLSIVLSLVLRLVLNLVLSLVLSPVQSSVNNNRANVTDVRSWSNIMSYLVPEVSPSFSLIVESELLQELVTINH